MVLGVYCFRNDLRLHDNPALQLAREECDQLLLVYAFEDRLWRTKKPKRISAHRARFTLDSLKCLEKKIIKLGGALHFLHGNIESSIPPFMEQVGATLCFVSDENAWEEKEAEDELSRMVNLRTIYSKTLLHLDDLPFDLEALPETFSNFRKLVEKQWIVRSSLETPDTLDLSPNPVSKLPNLRELGFNNPPAPPSDYYRFEGGTIAGRKRVERWIWEENCILNYKNTRNQLQGADFSSRLSPWISNGCLSPREIYWEIKKFESHFEANESTYWLNFELLWRDFFHFSARLHGPKIFKSRGIHPERPPITEPQNAGSLFSQWKDGRTNDLFINAMMHELRKTGWMSNRARQISASYLINDLGLDWRKGAQWFEEQLIDYDPCSNYGNWLYLSGYGNDPRKKRHFNVAKQAELYDPEGNYLRDWVRVQNSPISN
ncbi:MAG: deoxyribodipyrimidine photolyase [Opitutae bacterium]|nr:deoxyribodipyrimidine photolyase [Opitutae bacterium]